MPRVSLDSAAQLIGDPNGFKVHQISVLARYEMKESDLAAKQRQAIIGFFAAPTVASPWTQVDSETTFGPAPTGQF